MKRFKVLLGVIVGSALLLCLQYTAFAVPCGTGGVQWMSVVPYGCQDGVGSNDSESAVNDQEFFGPEDWTYIDKYRHLHNTQRH